MGCLRMWLKESKRFSFCHSNSNSNDASMLKLLHLFTLTLQILILSITEKVSSVFQTFRPLFKKRKRVRNVKTLKPKPFLTAPQPSSQGQWPYWCHVCLVVLALVQLKRGERSQLVQSTQGPFSWDEPVLGNVEKLPWSRKQQMVLNGFELRSECLINRGWVRYLRIQLLEWWTWTFHKDLEKRTYS